MNLTESDWMLILKYHHPYSTSYTKIPFSNGIQDIMKQTYKKLLTLLPLHPFLYSAANKK